MTCDAAQNRLLALSGSHRAPDEVRRHLAGCPGCRAFAAGVDRLDALVAAVPVPPSAEAKAAFLDRVTAPDPIIERIPTVPRRDSGFFGLPAAVGGVPTWKAVAGLAASVAVAAGVWTAAGNRKGTVAEQPAPRHELLRKEVAHLARLSTANSSKERMAVWVAVADDLRDETEAVYLYAAGDDVVALAGMYERAVNKGVVAQARHLRDQDRQEATKAANKLAETGDKADGLLNGEKRPHDPAIRRSLERIRDTARAGKAKLDAVARGEEV